MKRLIRNAREHKSVTILIIICFICLATAFSTGFWLLFRLTYVIIFGIPIAYFWAKSGLRGLEVTPSRTVDRVQEGQHFEERISVHNRSIFAKLWIEVEDPSTLPGHSAKRVITLGPRQGRTWRIDTLCLRRGLYSIGPVKVTVGDPFGLFTYTKTFGRPSSILVYPQALELPNFYVPPANLPGEGRFRRRTHYVTPNASGVRQYEYGDSFNRIHWPSSARTGQLMVKLFELDPTSDIWVILDLERDVHIGSGDDGTEEYAVKIAASVARYFTVASRSVGYMDFGAKLTVEEPERGANQYTRILENLAMANAVGDVPLADLLNEEGKRFGRHTTIVIVTPSTNESWVTSLQALTQRGVRAAVILLEASTFGPAEDSLLVFGALTASEIYTYLVKRSDDLLTALGNAGDMQDVSEAENQAGAV
jgi:uncharacterized protein (DUF58 family)